MSLRHWDTKNTVWWKTHSKFVSHCQTDSEWHSTKVMPTAQFTFRKTNFERPIFSPLSAPLPITRFSSRSLTCSALLSHMCDWLHFHFVARFAKNLARFSFSQSENQNLSYISNHCILTWGTKIDLRRRRMRSRHHLFSAANDLNRMICK